MAESSSGGASWRVISIPPEAAPNETARDREERPMPCPITDTHRAVEILHVRYAKLLYSVCIRILGNRHQAEDAVQDTFLNAFHRPGQLPAGASHPNPRR